MLSEVLLLLAGHESSLFSSISGDSPPEVIAAFAPLLHPGEKQCLEAIACIAWHYKTIRSACNTLRTTRYLAALCATIVNTLKDYENLLVLTEAKVLQRDEELVASGSFVPLSSIRAIFSEWDAPLAALHNLVATLENGPGGSDSRWHPGLLMDLLLDRAQSGIHRTASILSQIAHSVQRVWRIQLTAFLVHGTLSSEDALAAADKGYALYDHAIPSCVSSQTRESITYVGRAVATVKTAQWEKQLPRSLATEHTRLLDSVLPQDTHAFDRVIATIRVNVSEWLWKNVLTVKDVEEAVDSLANYFLLRNGEFGLSLIREIERLKLSRLTSRVASRTSIIREQDLQLALLRASLGTTAQHDPALSLLRFSLPSGPLRPLLPSLSNLGASVSRQISQTTFNDLLLGTPLTLTYNLTWPLDLFLQPSDLKVYSDIFAYLSSIRQTHNRVLECWTSLSNAQRLRRRWTGLGEGGTEDIEIRQRLLRCGWGVVREMLWFLQTLLGYIMADIVDTQFRKLKKQLRTSSGSEGMNPTTSHADRAPAPSSRPTSPTATTEHNHRTHQVLAPRHIDFSTLRVLHTQYLELVGSGSLLLHSCAATTRAILEICERLVAQVERWGGDILPALLFEGSIGGNEQEVGTMVIKRWETLKDINDTFHALLETFYEQLTASKSQPLTGPDVSAITLNASMVGVSMIRKGGKARSESDAETRRHVERLLLRLDFNGTFSKSDSHSLDNILRDGGLA